MADPEPTPLPDQADEGILLETLESDDSDTAMSSPSTDAATPLSQLSDNSGLTEPAPTPPPKPPRGPKQLLKYFNVYLALFIGVMLIAGAIIAFAYFQSRKQTVTPGQFPTQGLSESALEQVAGSDANVGSSQQVLNVQSNTVFAGKVLVRKDLEVAGNLQLGGTLGLNNLTVAGSSQVGQLQINKTLSVAGDTAIQGALTVAKSLQVSGAGSFGSVSAQQITTSALQLNGDLVLTNHLKTGGPPPGRSNGPALGGGGTTTVSGTDTGGTVTVNTGNNPPAGCFVNVTFARRYGNTPHVLLTPVGAGGGSVTYYVNRSNSGFSICTATPPPAGTSFGFDYFVVE